jgi:hypothetical protein
MDHFNLLWQPPSIATFTILFGVSAFTPHFAGTVDSNVDYSSRPTVFVSATVSCQALPHYCTLWMTRSDTKPTISVG